MLELPDSLAWISNSKLDGFPTFDAFVASRFCQVKPTRVILFDENVPLAAVKVSSIRACPFSGSPSTVLTNSEPGNESEPGVAEPSSDHVETLTVASGETADVPTSLTR